jgi:anti-sigma regulatory factor (Ser/Thr protein kinase)
VQVLVKQLEVGPDPAEVGRARRWVRAQFGRGQPCPVRPGPAETDTLVLLVSELVTNAVVHTGRPAVLRLCVGRDDGAGSGAGTGEGGDEGDEGDEGDGCSDERGVPVRLEVTDGSSRAPRPRRAAGEDTGGRGLELVELLADRWGWQREGDGKRVWCEVDCRAKRDAPPGRGARFPLAIDGMCRSAHS